MIDENQDVGHSSCWIDCLKLLRSLVGMLSDLLENWIISPTTNNLTRLSQIK